MIIAVPPPPVEVLRELRSELRYVSLLPGLAKPAALTCTAALYSVGGIRTTFTIGVGAGGPAAYW